MSRNGRNPKSPAFQWYPADFLSDLAVQAMSMQERGVYITLLSVAWLEDGLPDDQAILAKLCRMSLKDFQAAWAMIGPRFKAGDQGRMVNPRMERERAFQAEGRIRRLDASRAANAVRHVSASETNRRPIGDQSDPPLHPTPVALHSTPQTRDPTPGVKRSAARSPPTGPNADVIRHWESEWTRTRLGTRYEVQPKDGAAVARLLKNHTPLEVEERMTRALEMQDAFWLKAASPALVMSQWNQLAVTLAPNTSSKNDITQSWGYQELQRRAAERAAK